MIFSALRTLDISKITYFAIVFAAQMIVLEYYNEFDMLKKMVSFFFYKFLAFFLIERSNLTFDKLFEANQNNDGIKYFINRNLNFEAFFTKINFEMINLINQITFCRLKALEELAKIKISDRYEENNPKLDEELKLRFYKIEEIKARNLLTMFNDLEEDNSIKVNLSTSNSLKEFQTYCFDTQFLNEEEKKLEIEKKILLSNDQTSKNQNDHDLNIESKFFGKEFKKSFQISGINNSSLEITINKNISFVTDNVFHPIHTIQTLKYSKDNSEKEFNKTFRDLSVENLNIIKNPAESIFIVLAKICWNEKLSEYKNSKIYQICQSISHNNTPKPFDLVSEKKAQDNSNEENNLKAISSLYNSLLIEISK